MTSVLDRVVSIPGVHACAVFDAAGECMASETKPPYDAALLREASAFLRETWEVFQFLDDNRPDFIVAHHEGGCVATRRVEGGAILVVAEPTVQMAMLNVGMNIAVLRVTGESGSDSSLRGLTPGPPAASVRSAALSRASRPGSTPSVGGRTGPISEPTGGSRPSLSWTSSGGGALVIPPDAVGEQVVKELAAQLAKHVGPFARVMVKEELKALGASPRTLRRAAWRDLLDALLRSIPSAEKREAFMKDIKGLLPE